MTVYFVTYAWQRQGDTHWRYENQLLEGQDPITFLAELQDSPGEIYRLLFFTGIPTAWGEKPVVRYALDFNAGEIAPLEEVMEHHGGLLPPQAERDDSPEGL